jgi:hypothetical protein
VSVYDSPTDTTIYLSLKQFSRKLEVLRLGYNYANRDTWPNTGVERVGEGSGDMWIGIAHYLQAGDRVISLFSNGDVVCQARVVLSYDGNGILLCRSIELKGLDVGLYDGFKVMLQSGDGVVQFAEWKSCEGSVIFETDDAKIVPLDHKMRIVVDARSNQPNDRHSAYCLWKKPKEAIVKNRDMLVRLQILELSSDTGDFIPAPLKNDAFSLVCGMQRKIAISVNPISSRSTKTKVISAEIGGIILTRNGIDHVCTLSTRYPLVVSHVSKDSSWNVMSWDSSLSACKYLNTVSRDGDLINVSLDIKLECVAVVNNSERVIVVPIEIQMPVRFSTGRDNSWLSSLFDERASVMNGSTLERIYGISYLNFYDPARVWRYVRGEETLEGREFPAMEIVGAYLQDARRIKKRYFLKGI